MMREIFEEYRRIVPVSLAAIFIVLVHIFQHCCRTCLQNVDIQCRLIHYMAEQMQEKSTKKSAEQTESKTNMPNQPKSNKDLTKEMVAEMVHKRSYRNAPDAITEAHMEEDDEEDTSGIQLTDEEIKEAEAKHTPVS